MRWRSLRLIVAGIVLLVGISGTPAHAAAPSLVTDEAAWILQTAQPSGAISTNPDGRLVWPYLANYAASGLARGAAQGNTRAAAAGWAWTRWYQAHEDANGYVTDYAVGPTGLVSNGNMDSTDAYAGTYLVAVRDLAFATNDTASLGRVRAGVTGALRAIESTQDADGLTWAKPSWQVKYLMDNAEAYGGLVAAGDIARMLGDTALATRADADAKKLHDGVARLWNPTTGSYDWAVHGNGARQPTNWNVMYPDAMQQVWAVAWGLTDTSTGTSIMKRFSATAPPWASPTAPVAFSDGTRPIGYWGVACWAMRKVGGNGAVCATSIRVAALATGRAWPYTSAVAGQLIVASAPVLTPKATTTPTTTTSTTLRSVRPTSAAVVGSPPTGTTESTTTTQIATTSGQVGAAPPALVTTKISYVLEQPNAPSGGLLVLGTGILGYLAYFRLPRVRARLRTRARYLRYA